MKSSAIVITFILVFKSVHVIFSITTVTSFVSSSSAQSSLRPNNNDFTTSRTATTTTHHYFHNNNNSNKIMSQLQQRHRPSSSSSSSSSNTLDKTSTTTKTELFASFSSHPVTMGSTNILIFICTNILGCIITLLKPYSHYHVDILGTGAFCLSGWYTLRWCCSSSVTMPPIRTVYSSIAVILWSSRLALFLLYRIIQQQGHDQRLTPVLSVPSSAIGFWLVSALWGIICSIPHWMGAITALPLQSSSSSFSSKMVSASTTSNASLYIGIITFLIGFGIETTADAQKWFFKQTSNQFCHVGVWKLSQHPNWLGNLILWIGIFIMNSSSYLISVPSPAAMKYTHRTILRQCVSVLHRYHRFALAALGPIFMYLLFYSQATGIILGDTLQANQIKYGYGTNVEYTNYIDHTPLIVPNLPKLIVHWIRSQ